MSPDLDLVYSLFVSAEGVAFVGNSYMGIFRSKDKGLHWQSVNTGINNAYFFAFGQSTTGRIFAAAWPSGTYYSNDFGEHWSLVNDILLAGVEAFSFTARNQNVYAGTSEGIMRSTDDGITWSYVRGISGEVSKLVLSPNGDLLSAVRGVGIFRSGNDGRTWDQINGGLGNYYINDLAFDSQGRLFAATNSGIYRLDEYVSSANLTQPAAKISSYPNPSGGSVRIGFEFAGARSGSFVLYDILGRKVDNIRIDNSRYGQIQWNIRGGNQVSLPSGVYLMRFEADGGSFISGVTKLVILR
jgi:ligand-binding sensor domain-containing protein